MLISQIHPIFYHGSVFAHRILRYMKYIKNHSKYSKKRNLTPLEKRVKIHKSILLRKLGDADMQLQVNKITNLKIAKDRINGILIYPGQTFSLWQLVGKPTYKKGYTDGIVLIFDKFESGVGGGLCQLANLLYWMALHSPLEVTERHRHGYDVFPDSGRVIPFGTGATIFYNYVDLQFFNPTNQIFQINLDIDDKYLKGEIKSDKTVNYSYKIYEKDHKFIFNSTDKQYYRSNKIYRKVIDKRTGNTIKRELISENNCKMSYIPSVENKILVI